jgi:hypothetical protein
MKSKIMMGLAIGAVALALRLNAATDAAPKTITGDGACAKCTLKETKDCRLTITVEEDGKRVVYYLVPNHVSKEFGNPVCTEKKKIKASGTVKTVDGKREFKPTKIELAKD